MVTIRAYTTIEQSKKLAEILPLESADMWYEDSGLMIPRLGSIPKEHTDTEVPCWSLSALLSLIRETIGYTLYGVNNVYMSCDLGDKPWKLETEVYNNEVDACVAMVEKLHELNLL